MNKKNICGGQELSVASCFHLDNEKKMHFACRTELIHPEQNKKTSAEEPEWKVTECFSVERAGRWRQRKGQGIPRNIYTESKSNGLSSGEQECATHLI